MAPVTSLATALLFATLGLAAPAAESASELEARQMTRRFTYYDLPTQASGPCDMTTGPDGNIWVQDFFVNKFARLDIGTGKFKEYDIPYTRAPLNSSVLPGSDILLGRTGLTACVVQPGSDGNLYLASGVRNQFVKFDLKTEKVSVFDTGNPLGNLEPFNDMWRGPKGMFFSQTTANKITLFNYKTQKLRSWTPPTANSGPLGMYVASDGGVWFAEFLANKIGRLNATDGTFKEYDVPLSGSQPAVVRAETRLNGRNYLWFTGFVGNSMISIDIQSGAVKTYTASTVASFPTEDTVDSFGRVWFSTIAANQLNFLIPKSGIVTNIATPGSIIQNPIGLPPALQVAVHYGPKNRIWFTETANNRVGSYQLYGCGNTITPCTA